MKIEDEQQAAFTLCLLFLSSWIPCWCLLPSAPSGAAARRAGMPGSPSHCGERQGLGWAAQLPQLHWQGDVQERHRPGKGETSLADLVGKGGFLPSPWNTAQFSPAKILWKLRAHLSLRDPLYFILVILNKPRILRPDILAHILAVTYTFIKDNSKTPSWLRRVFSPSTKTMKNETWDPNTAKTNCQHVRNTYRKIWQINVQA